MNYPDPGPVMRLLDLALSDDLARAQRRVESLETARDAMLEAPAYLRHPTMLDGLDAELRRRTADAFRLACNPTRHATIEAQVCGGELGVVLVIGLG